MGADLLLFEHPPAIDTDVLFVVDPCPPHRLTALADGAGHEQVPAGAGGVAGDLDAGVQAVVQGKDEVARDASKELAYGLSAFEAAEALAFPGGVRDEQGCNSVRVVVVVAGGGVLGLQVTNLIGVLQGPNPVLEFCHDFGDVIFGHKL